MKPSDLIDKTKIFVQETLVNAEGGHDWFHIQRVFLNAQQIAKTEKVNSLVVSLGALLHDIADAKFHDGDETIGPKKALQFLKSHKVEEPLMQHVVQIIKHISF